MDLDEYLKNHAMDTNFVFFPCIHYNEDGKMIEFYWDNEEAYAKEIHDKNGKSLGCIYIGQNTKNIVGVNIYNVRPD